MCRVFLRETGEKETNVTSLAYFCTTVRNGLCINERNHDSFGATLYPACTYVRTSGRTIRETTYVTMLRGTLFMFVGRTVASSQNVEEEHAGKSRDSVNTKRF